MIGVPLRPRLAPVTPWRAWKLSEKARREIEEIRRAPSCETIAALQALVIR